MSGRTKPAPVRPFQFEGLPSYSRHEVTLWNWCHRFFGGTPAWKNWIQEAWGGLLEAPEAIEIGLTQKHSVDPQEQIRKYTFKERDISIGRDTDNRIILQTLSVGKRHARIFVENDQCFLEDLGSALGTYLNQSRLPAKQPHPVANNDQIAIFPYTFTVSLKQLWAPQKEIRLYSPSAETMTWQTFLDTSTKGRATFSIHLHPTGGVLCLEAGRAFLTEIVDGLLRPLQLDRPRSTLSPQDSGLLEFVVVSLLERVNRDLAFPFQCDTGPVDSRPAWDPEARGIVLTSSLNLLAATGPIRVFAPYALFNALPEARSAVPSRPGPSAVSWKFPVSLGHVQLSVNELSSLERDDVLLFEAALELVFPGNPDYGWKIAGAGSPTTLNEVSNLPRVQLDKYFVRERVTNKPTEPGDSADKSRLEDLGQLPVRVHVIVSEKELTLAEANGLVSGSILELDGEKNGLVKLALNGRIMGEGQLVEVDGRLGVKILSWKGA